LRLPASLHRLAASFSERLERSQKLAAKRCELMGEFEVALVTAN
jgi:hypothetical protein